MRTCKNILTGLCVMLYPLSVWELKYCCDGVIRTLANCRGVGQHWCVLDESPNVCTNCKVSIQFN